MAELDVAIKDPANTDLLAAALAALKRASLSTDYTLPPLTFNNIRELASRPPAKHQPNLARLYLEGLRRINNLTNGQLFASNLPRLETIRQGASAIAFVWPQRRRRFIATRARLPPCFPWLEPSLRRQDRRRVRCRRVAHRRGAGHGQAGEQRSRWPLGESLRGSDGQLHNSLKLPDQQSDSPIEAIVCGGSAGKIISFLTGHKVSGFSLEFGKNPAASPALLDTNWLRCAENWPMPPGKSV